MNFSVLTINIWKNDGPYFDRLNLLASGILQLQPDIIFTQEVFESVDRAISTHRFLAEKTGYKCLFAPARRKTRALSSEKYDSYSGMMFMLKNDRFNVIEYRELQLPSPVQDGERVAQLLCLEIEENCLLLGNLHLTYLPKATEWKLKQVLTVVNHPFWNRPAGLKLLAGDFNTTPTDTLWNSLSENGINLTDAYLTGGGTLPGYTIGPYQNVNNPDLRIDYIFSLQEGPVFSGAKIVMGKECGNGLRASDHFAVWVNSQLSDSVKKLSQN